MPSFLLTQPTGIGQNQRKRQKEKQTISARKFPNALISAEISIYSYICG